MGTNTTTPHTFTINVYGAHKGQDHTYTTPSRKVAYDTRDFWISEGYTAIVSSPLVHR